MNILRRIARTYAVPAILSTLILTSAPLNAQVKLPVTIINGKECFYYKPKSSSETVYGLSKKLGLTREEIVAYNPGVADGIRKNSTIYFPVADFRDRIEVDPEGTDVVVRELPDNRLKPVNIKPEIEESEGTSEEAPAVTTAVVIEEPENRLKPVHITYEIDSTSAEEAVPYSIAVVLPFGLDKEEMERPARMATDFYKGFLIAADTLSRRGESVAITAIDASLGLEKVLKMSEVMNASVIVAPENPDFIQKAIDAEVKGYIVNTLNFADTLYLSEPQVVQTNIPHSAMYVKAVDNIIASLDGATPVIITNSAGRNDKEAFTSYLRGRLADSNIAFDEIKYDGTLTVSDLEGLRNSARTAYAIIPSAGSIGEFNRFSHALNNFRVANPDLKLMLFGYPEWVTFRGDAQDMLHTLGATIYSRFNDDYTSFSARNIQEAFSRWYGTPMIESIPSQGLLGYDLGCMLIKNLRANGGVFDPENPAAYEGIQSTFRLQAVPGDEGGYVNDALYIVHYLPLTGTDYKVL